MPSSSAGDNNMYNTDNWLQGSNGSDFSGMEMPMGANGSPDPGSDGSFNTAGSGEDVPIDGGLGFLLAAGAGYGARRIRKQMKKKKDKEMKK